MLLIWSSNSTFFFVPKLPWVLSVANRCAFGDLLFVCAWFIFSFAVNLRIVCSLLYCIATILELYVRYYIAFLLSHLNQLFNNNAVDMAKLLCFFIPMPSWMPKCS